MSNFENLTEPDGHGGIREKLNRMLSGLFAWILSFTNNDQIKGLVFLTVAEYNALPSSKETDGKIYMTPEE